MNLLELLKNKQECDNLLQGFENVWIFLDRKIGKTEKDLINLESANKDIKRLEESTIIINRHINYCYN